MLKLSGFADEISPDLGEQIKTCRELAVTHIELRAVAGKNVLDFDDALRNEVRSRLKDSGLGVISIGSPIGKVKINDPWDKHFDRFKIAVEMAHFFSAPLLRIFSYYPPDGGNILEHRDEVMKRMAAKADYVKNMPQLMLVHENESKIFGEKGVQCLDIMKTVNSPKMKMAFDFANFVVEKENTLECWKLLKPYTIHIHIKDAVMSTRQIVPAGQGDGNVAAILVDAVKDGYDGFLSLEPHLAHAGQMQGFSGPERFKIAADALKKLCRENKLPLAGA